MENGGIIVGIFVPTPIDESFFETTVFFADENFGFFVQVIPFSIYVPICDHWGCFKRFLLTLKESFGRTLDTNHFWDFRELAFLGLRTFDQGCK